MVNNKRKITSNLERKEAGHEKISFTALNVAYYRTLTDIAYSREIFDAMVAVCAPEEIAKFESRKSTDMAPLIEARYKLVKHLLAESHSSQVLELAAGFSQHGLEFTNTNPGARYVEVDLPNIARAKDQVLKNLQTTHTVELSKNFHLQTGDVINEDTFKKAEQIFEHKSITVINEGLLRYLDFEQRAAVAKNIHMLLKKFGGVWITPDISVENTLQIRHPGMRAKLDVQRQQIEKASGVNISQNRFKDVAAAKEFFENLGFDIQVHSFREVLSEITSPARLGLTSEEVEELIGDAVVFVMKPST